MNCSERRRLIYSRAWTSRCPGLNIIRTRFDRREKILGRFAEAGTLHDVDDTVMAHRTPGFIAWQEGQWLTCCAAAAAYLGAAGAKELKGKFAEAIPAVEQDWDGDWRDLDKDGQPAAYIFLCLHCKQYLAYVDQT